MSLDQHDAYGRFDHRTRKTSLLNDWLVLFATDPVNGLAERQPRVRTLLVGSWKVSITKRRSKI